MIKKRNLDGVYFRIKREDKWDSICLSDMTAEERQQLFEDKNPSPKFLIGCIDILCKTIRSMGDTFDIYGHMEGLEEKDEY